MSEEIDKKVDAFVTEHIKRMSGPEIVQALNAMPDMEECLRILMPIAMAVTPADKICDTIILLSAVARQIKRGKETRTIDDCVRAILAVERSVKMFDPEGIFEVERQKRQTHEGSSNAH